MITLNTIFYVCTALIIIEVCLTILIWWLRQNCPWLITSSDEFPRLDPRGLKSFVENGWDSELGWTRKPNTSGIEKGRNDTDVTFEIDSSGARLNPGFEKEKPKVLAYGDSYTFARQVENNETWAHFLSKNLNANVANYGVGNYGLDQALLRLEREFDNHPAPVVIIGVVPETMSRIHAYWKHFSEYGNTFAFKPRFELDSEELCLRPSFIRDATDFDQIKEQHSRITKADYFYEKKFKRDILFFPFSISLFKNPFRTLPLIGAALTDRLGLTRDAAFTQVMRRNINMNRELYRTRNSIALFAALVRRFVDFCKSRNTVPVLVMLPQRMDMEKILQGDHYYESLLQEVSDQLTVIDVAPALAAEREINKLYINDKYGGHLSKAGNQVVADFITPICERFLHSTHGKGTADGSGTVDVRTHQKGSAT